MINIIGNNVYIRGFKVCEINEENIPRTIIDEFKTYLIEPECFTEKVYTEDELREKYRDALEILSKNILNIDEELLTYDDILDEIRNLKYADIY